MFILIIIYGLFQLICIMQTCAICPTRGHCRSGTYKIMFTATTGHGPIKVCISYHTAISVVIVVGLISGPMGIIEVGT